MNAEASESKPVGRGEAPEDRRISTLGTGRALGLTQNLGGSPRDCVSFVSVVGTEPTD